MFFLFFRYGNQETYNVNQLLVKCITQSDYYRSLVNLKTYHEVIDEIYDRVCYVEPWSAGTSRIPSTAFCLLFKFFTMRLTSKQMHGLLRHQDSIFIRCIGFLYLRYTSNPKDLWTWLEPYLEDPEIVIGSDPSDKVPLGKWLQKILTEIQFYGTTLPRIPVMLARKFKLYLLLHEQKSTRASTNRRYINEFIPGVKVRAIYSDEQFEPDWYDAVIDSIEETEKFLVTFPEYGNTSLVTLGEIELTLPTNQSGQKNESKDGEN
jgi:pre-mRNA-splicing factor 38B